MSNFVYLVDDDEAVLSETKTDTAKTGMSVAEIAPGTTKQ